MLSSIKSKYKALLQYGTEFLGLDLKYFVRGGFWTATGQITNAILATGLTIAFANLLPKETFGLYRYVLSLAGIMAIFSLNGANTAVAQAVATGNEGVLKTSVKYQLKWNLMMATALFISAGYYFWNNNHTIAYALLVLGIFSPLTSAFNTYGAYLSGKKEFRLDNIFSVVSSIFYSAGMILVLFLSKTLIAVILAYSLTTFFSNLFFYFKTVKLFSSEESPSKEALAYARKLTFIGFIGPIVSQIDNIILNNFWGPVQLATYSLALTIPDRLMPFAKSFVDVGFPKLAQRSREEINSVFYKRILQGLGIGVVLALGYIFLAPIIFKYLMPKYLDAVFYSQILATGLIFALPIRYVGTAMAAQGRTKIILANSLVNATIRIFMFAILGIWGGIMGLALAYALFCPISLLISIMSWQRQKRT